MNIKTYLREISDYNRKIQNKLELIDTLRAMGNLPNGTCYDKVLVEGTKNQDPPFVKYIDKIIRYEKDIEQYKQQIKNRQDWLIQNMDFIESDIAQRVFTKRYLKLEPFTEIAHEMSYSESTIFRFHGIGLQQLEENIKNYQKNKDDSK